MPSWLKKSEKPEKGDDLEEKKSSLFGGRKAAKSPAPAAANPYAHPPPSSNPYAQQSSNPYANQSGANDPYAPRSQSSLTTPPASSFGNLTLKSQSEPGVPPAYDSRSSTPNRYEKSAVPQGGYGASSSRYQSRSDNGYGQTGGYNSNPYGSGAPQVRAGGYGALGRSNSQETTDTDAGRDALFGSAAQRAQKQTEQSNAATEYSDPSYSNTGTSGNNGAPGAYGYGDNAERELTQEEQEDQDVEAAKMERKQIVKESISSTNRSLQVIEATLATAQGSLAMLNEQGDRIHNTERNLDNASALNKYATQQTKTLQKVDGSMLGFDKGELFRKKYHRDIAVNNDIAEHQRNREDREDTARRAYENKARQEEASRKIGRVNGGGTAGKKDLTQRSAYLFEADSEDEAAEDQIDDNLGKIHQGVRALNALSHAQGREIEAQIKHIETIGQKTEKVDDQIAANNARLRRM